MNDVETIQRERGWRECERHNDCGEWHRGRASKGGLPDPLADTPEGWWEFGQILKWAQSYFPGHSWYQITTTKSITEVEVVVDGLSVTLKRDADFREACIAALAAAIRRESEDKR